MTTLRLELIARDEPLDLALEARRFVLWRQGAQVSLTLDDAEVAGVRRRLALRGVRTVSEPVCVPVAPALVRAVGTGLEPVRLATGDLDVLEVRRIPLGEATAGALRRPFRHWPWGSRRRARCHALLRGTDAVLEVRRSAWCDRSTLRAGRHALRPVLFNTGARSRPLRVHASERRLTRWIQG